MTTGVLQQLVIFFLSHFSYFCLDKINNRWFVNSSKYIQEYFLLLVYMYSVKAILCLCDVNSKQLTNMTNQVKIHGYKSLHNCVADYILMTLILKMF